MLHAIYELIQTDINWIHAMLDPQTWIYIGKGLQIVFWVTIYGIFTN